MATGIPIYLEIGSKKAFACAIDWPGWARAARNETEATEALVSYVTRYEAVVSAAGLELPAPAKRGSFDVVARLKGDATTDFGAPGAIPAFDVDGPTPAKWNRQLKLLHGCWTVFDEVVAAAPRELLKGPRGGGRDRDQIAAHVIESEASYSRMTGLDPAKPDPSDPSSVSAARMALIQGLHELRKRGPRPGPRGGKRWPAAYAVRRIAWHVTDHLWEIEDKTPT